MPKQKELQLWQQAMSLVIVCMLLIGMPSSLLAQENQSSDTQVKKLYLPIVVSQSERTDELLASYSIAVGENDEPLISEVSNSANTTASSAATEQIRLKVVIIPDMRSVTASAIDAISCPWGGTGASRISSGWFYNPNPDRDFYIDYKVPRNYRESVVCITAALWTALKVTGKSLAVNVYSYDANNYRMRVVIGSSVVRNVCLALVRTENCANWLLEQQASIRYTT